MIDRRTSFDVESFQEDTDMGTTEAKKNETDEQKFKRLATVRVNKVLQQLGNLGKLYHHKPTEPQINVVFAAIDEGTKAAKEMWQGKRKEKPAFTL